MEVPCVIAQPTHRSKTSFLSLRKEKLTVAGMGVGSPPLYKSLKLTGGWALNMAVRRPGANKKDPPPQIFIINKQSQAN